ncbi:MAG: ArsC/Spx/MgsR family protein [Crocinitomicaceae bacterium]
MKNITILHNPNCTKSRCALDWLSQNNYQIDIKEYMKIPLSAEELKTVLRQLNLKPKDILRSKEKDYIDFVRGNYNNDEELIHFMIRFPKLIERPIVLWQGGGVLARPLENLVNELQQHK